MKTVKTNAATATTVTVAQFNLDALHVALAAAKSEYRSVKSKVEKAVEVEPVYSAAREELTKELRTALEMVRKAQNQYAIAAGNLEGDEPMYDRCIVEDTEFSLESDKLDLLIEKKRQESEKEDSDTVDKRRLVFSLISLLNMRKAFENLAAVDARLGTTGNDLELLVRRGFDMALDKACNKSEFENIFHTVFGGKIGQIVKQPKDTLDFCAQQLEELGVSLPELRDSLNAVRLGLADVNFNTLKVDPGSVYVTDRTVRIGLGDTKATMTWKEVANRSQYLNQIVFITLDSAGNYAVAKKSLNAYERLVSLYLSGVDFEGLRTSKNTLAVVVVPKGKKGLSRARVVNIPFTNDIPESKLTMETVNIHRILKNLAREVGPVLNAEQFGRHGYVQLVDTYLKSEANAFVDKDGNSYEDPAKLLARLQKLAYNASTISHFTDVHVVAGVNKKDLPASVNPAHQKMFNMALSRALVGGNLIPTLPLFNNIGTVRVVSGSNEGESGQKGMLGDAYYTANLAMISVMETMGDVVNEEFVIAGMNSTKAATFKLGTSGWELKETTYQGNKVVFWAKSSIGEELKITDSATAELYEVNPDNIKPLQHVEAALDSLARVVNKKQSQSVMSMLYTNRPYGVDLYQHIKNLLGAGVIRVKRIGNKTNSQLNAGLEFQHGVENARIVLEFLIAQNKATNYRQDLANASFLFAGNDLGDKVANIDAEELIKSLAEDVYADGRVDNLESQVWNMIAVRTLVNKLKEANKPFVKFVFPTTGKEVVVPMSRKVVEAFENVERPNDIRVSGLLAELLFAFGFFISRSKKVFDKVTQLNEYEIDFSSVASVNNTIEKITSARDRSFGKPLSQIPTIGVNCFLITSALLHKNEILSERVNAARYLAEKEYQQKVTGIYTKPPVLWMGSITGVKFVVSVKEASAERKALFLDSRPEFHEIMMGNAAYQSPEKAIGNGNDADGDRISVDMIPTALLVGCPDLHPEVYVDARKTTVAAGGHFYAQFWEDEMKGMIRNPAKTLGDFKVTAENFEKSMVDAIFAASKAKAAVAIYTTHQTTVMNNRGVFATGVKVALLRLLRDKRVTSMKSWIENVLASEFALAEVTESIWKFTLDVQGACVNFDAMDQVKDSSGRDTKKLAEVLSPSALKYNSVTLIDEEGMVTDEQKAEYAVQKLNKRVKLISDTMFDKDAHNISYDQLLTVLPKADEVEIKFFLSYVVAFANQEVGVYTHFYFDACQQIMKPIKSKVSNIEDAMQALEERNLTQVKTDCVARSMLKSAFAFLNKKLTKKES